MFRIENIPTNFNGYIALNNENYFFNVYNDILRIFYNQTGVNTARDFRDKYRCILEKGLIYGECPDNRRVIFLLDGENYSSYPEKYSEFRLKGCIKEIYYYLETDSTPLLTDKKFDNFNIFNTLSISGSLINSICPQNIVYFNYNGEMQIDNFSAFEETQCISPINIELLSHLFCEFSVSAKHKQDVINGVVLDTKINFSFGCPQTIEMFQTLYVAIKKFVDFMAKARNTDFIITLAQLYNGKSVEFAEVKIFNKYNNICNKEFRDVLYLDAIKENIPTLFKNLCDKKYPLFFLPIDNNDYGKVRFTDIQNLNTAIELASELDEKYSKLKPKPQRQDIAKKKAEIIFEWCKKYVDIIHKTQPQHKGLFEPFYYNLTAENIEAFRKVRNDITHRATGQIDLDIFNCFIALRSIFYYYVLDLDAQTKIRIRI
ncbi:MAG: hypothetical protein HDR02_19490 [Lachnospiraceae bacterium]|nr:hypothetical protein [Lachnospiraceae bacterium]